MIQLARVKLNSNMHAETCRTEKVKMCWASYDSRADGMAMGYSPVSVFLSRALLFVMNGLGMRFYFLAEKLRYRTYNLSH